jgi:uncharacterized membrane protein (Fun14 family)
MILFIVGFITGWIVNKLIRRVLDPDGVNQIRNKLKK